MIGTASETAIRFLRELREEKVISQKGKVMIINNLSRLRSFAH
jgi:hypothetical protein